MSGKYVVVYNVVEVARGHTPEKSLREYIKDLILMDNGNLWATMEPYFVPPGREGRRDYDHAEAISYLKRDSKIRSRDKKMPDPLENLNTAALVPHVLKVLGMIGFVVKNGKIIGTKTEQDEESPLPVNDDSEETEELAMAA